MPPHAFSTTAAAAAAASSSSSSASNTTIALPKPIVNWLKDLSQKLKLVLLPPDEPTRNQSLRILAQQVSEHVQTLGAIASQADAATAAASTATNGATSSSSTLASSSSVAASTSTSSGTLTITGDATGSSSNGAASPITQIRALVSTRITSMIVDLIHGQLERRLVDYRPALVELIETLLPLLGFQSIITEWWDLVLRPLLKSSAVENVTANRARQLVIAAMTAVPSSAYQDQPPPVAIWPQVTNSPLARKQGDAPYPLSSVQPPSPSASRKVHIDRNPSTSSTASSSAASTSRTSPASRIDMYRRFTQRIFDLYLSETADNVSVSAPSPNDTPHPQHQQSPSDSLSSSAATLAPATNPTAVDPESEPCPDDYAYHDPLSLVWRANLESIILVFSNQRPKEFFHHITESFSEPNHRVPLLFLLTTFLRLYPIHTYHITATPLPSQLVLSLQLDTSTMCVSLGVTALVMLIPHIPDWIANGGAGGLPTLLSIYARIVDWRKLSNGWENWVGDGPELQALRNENDQQVNQIERIRKCLNIRPGLKWHRLETSFDYTACSPPNAEQLFTYLYGLFPCNMLRFLRAPIDYLRKAYFDSPFDGPWEDLMDEAVIQNRSGPILQRHTLHLALITLSAESELTDKQRWMKHDSADINAECLSLFLGRWHDTNSELAEQAHRSRQRSLDAVDDDSVSLSSGRRPSHSESGRRQPSSQQRFFGSPISSLTKSYHQLPNTVNPDEILLTHASLRSGALLLSSAMANTASNWSSSGVVVPTEDREVVVSREAQLPRPVTMVSSSHGPAALTKSNSVGAPTSATSSATASASIPSSSMPSSPVTNAVRARARTRSGSMSSVVSVLPRSGATSPIQPTRQHPLSASHTQIDHAAEPLSASPTMVRSGTRATTTASWSSEIGFLQRENLLLRNELNFELYLKEQYLRHIGRLHRDKVTDTALEAERQNLYHTVRSLRSQMETLVATLERQRVEAAVSKTHRTAWEAELNNKLKAYREERKAWTSEARQLKAQAEENGATIQTLSRQLEDCGSELFELRTKLAAAEPKLARIEQYEAKIRQLTTCLVHWDQDVTKFEEQRKQMEKLLAQWDEMVTMVEATEHAFQSAESKAEKLDTQKRRLEIELETVLQKQQQQQPSSKNNNVPHYTSLVEVEKQRDQLESRCEILESQLLNCKAKLETYLTFEGQQQQQQQQLHGPSPLAQIVGEESIPPVCLD